MMLMAKSPPENLPQLKAVRGIGAEQADRRGHEILAAVKRGLSVPDAELPHLERPMRRTTDPAYEARLERLKSARNLLAAEYDLGPGVLCPNGTLEAIARMNPSSLAQLAQVPELHRWQLGAIGERLLIALHRPSA
jgi:ribonuclease D